MKNFPNSYVIIAAIIVICAVLTWFLPGGEYVTGEDGTVIYESVASTPQTWQVFSALYDGFSRQAGIIVFILIVGGAFWLLNATGAVEYGIDRFIARVGKYDKLVLVGLSLLFSLCGAVFGMSEETIPFVGIVVPLVMAMGYDAITGLLIVYVAANVGFSGAFLNPFTVGIAQEMSGLPLFSGMGCRLVCWSLLTAALIVFVLAYSSRIKKTPQQRVENSALKDCRDAKKNVILWVLLITVIVLILGVVKFKWYMAEISALFLCMGIICGIIGGFSANKIVSEFLAGAKDILSAAMVVGLASGIIVILENGHIVGSMLHALESGLESTGEVGTLASMYGVQALINLIIPSATAKAAITIPIMAPLCDLIGLSRQAMVIAFQFGDGFTNMITPTSGVLIASLGMAGVSYDTWLRKAWKPVLILIVAGFLLLLFSNYVLL